MNTVVRSIPSRRAALVLAGSIAALLGSYPAQAATYYWDADGNPIGDSSSLGIQGGGAAGTGLGGTGAWDSSSLFWFRPSMTGFTTPSEIAWPNLTTDVADFMGTAGTVTLAAGGINAGAVQFLTTGYTLTGGALTLGAGNGISTTNVFVASGLASTINSVIAGSSGLVLGGGGTLTLNNTETYTGSTILDAGSGLSLDFTAAGAPTTNMIGSASALVLNSGILAIKTATSGAVVISQSFASTAINGAAVISLTTSGVNTALSLGALTHGTGGTLQFTVTPGTAAAGNVVTTGNTNTNGILGPWAFTSTTSNLKYATVNGSGQITGLTGTAAATQTNLTDTTGAVNYELAALSGTTPASVSANTIRYTGATGTLAPGATLFQLNGLITGANATASTLTLGSGDITIGSTNELVIAVGLATSALNITGALKNNGANVSALTVGGGGAGTVTLSKVAAYTGPTTLNSGTLALGIAGALGSTSGLVINGGTFNEATFAQTVPSVSLTAGTISGTTGVLTSTAAFDVQSGTINAQLAGTAGLIKTTAGTVTYNPPLASTLSGGITIKAGVLVLGGLSNVNAFGTGIITLGDTSGSADARLVFAGTNATYSNAIALASGTTGQLSIGTSNGSTAVTFTGGITGSNNITVTGNSTSGAITFSTGTINNTGTFTNGVPVGAIGTGGVTVTLPFGTNLTAINQSGGTSPLTLAATNGAAMIVGAVPVNITSGTLSYAFTGTNTAVTNILGTGAISLTPGATLSFSVGSITDTIPNVFTIPNLAGTANITVSGGISQSAASTITFAAGANTPTLKLTNSNGVLFTHTVAGAISGPGNLQLNPTGITAPITLSGAQNQTGSISNVGTNAATASLSTLSGTIGANITGISQAGANPFTVTSAVPLNAVGLNNFTSTGAGTFTISGAISGAQPLTLAANSTGSIVLSNTSINNGGTLTNSGNGFNTVTLSGNLGALVGNVTQNSATSQLTLSGTNPATSGQVFTASNGVLEFLNTASLPGYPAPSTGRVVVSSGGILGLGYGSANQFTATDVANIASGATSGISFSATGAGLGLDTGTANATAAFAIGEPSGVSLGLFKLGGNTLTLSGANTYSGATAIRAGAVSVASIGNVGATNGPLGAPATAANGTLSLGFGATTGQLIYTGSGETTDRVLNLAGVTGGANIDQSGTGLLKFSSAMTFTGIGAKTLTLQGSTSGTGEISGLIAGNGSLGTSPLTIAKAGTGTWTLSGTGNTAQNITISGGTLDTGSDGIGLSRVGLQILTATGNATVNGRIILNSTTSTTDGPDIGGNAAGVTLTLNAIIANGSSSLQNVDFGGNAAATTILTGANTFSGVVQINSQILQVSSLNSVSGGTASSNLGVPSSVANGTILISGASILKYVGPGETTDRIISLNSTTTNGGLDASGSGLLKFTSPLSVAAFAHTLTLQGSGAGEFAGTLLNNTSTFSTAITKTGTGTWTLSANNGGAALGYTGATTISQGTLALAAGGSLNNTAISVASGATFAVLPGSGSVTAGLSTGAGLGARLTLPAGSNFSMIDGATGTFNLTANATFASAPLTLSGGTLNLELSSTAADQIVVTGANTPSVFSPSYVNFTGLGASLSAGDFSIVSATGIATGNANFLFPNGTATQMLAVGSNVYTLTLSSAVTGVEKVTVGAAGSSALTWTGLSNGDGAVNSAWSTTPATLNFATGVTAADYVDGNAVTFQDTNTVTGTPVTNGTVIVQAAGVTPSLVTVNNSAVLYTFSNESASLLGIAGTTDLVKSGSGTLILNGVNTYSGATVIGGGILRAGVAGALGSGTISFTGGTLQYALGNTQDYSNRFATIGGQAFNIDTNGQAVTFASPLTSSGGVLTKSGAGTLTLSGTNLYSGINNISTGSLSVSSDANLGANSSASALTFPVASTGTLNVTGSNTLTKPITLNGPGIIEVGGTDAPTWSGVISGAGALTKSGSGVLTLSVTNTFSGAVNVSGGLLAYAGTGTSADPAPLGTGTKNVNLTNGGGIRVTGNFSNPTGGGKSYVIGTGGGVFDVQNGAGLQLDDAGQFGGTGDLTVQGAGTGFVFLSNQAFGFTGNVTVNSATLRLGTNSVLGTTTGRSITINSGGVLDLNSTTLSLPASTGITLNGTGISSAGALLGTAAYTLASDINLATASSIGGTATLTVSGVISGAGLTKVGANTLILTGANASSGTIISLGTLQLGSGGTTGSLATSGTFTNNGTFAINRSNAVAQGTDFSASAITGTGGLTQSGTGTTTLTAANTYSGTTLVSGGTLTMTGVGTLGSGPLNIPGGLTAPVAGILDLNGTSQSVGALSGITNTVLGSILNNGGGASTLTVIGGTYAGTIKDNTTGTGTVALVNSGQLTLSAASTFSGGTTVNGLAAGNPYLQLTTATAAGTGPIALSSGNGLLFGVAGTFANNLSGAGFVENYNGTALVTTLSGNLSYTGATLFRTAGSTIAFSPSANSTLSGAIGTVGAGFGATSVAGGLVTKLGANKLTLTGTSVYTGATTISAGTLALGSGGNLGATALTVGSGGTFAATPGVNGAINALTGSLTLNSGSAFTMADGFTSSFNVTGNSVLSPATGLTVPLTFDIGGLTTAADLLAIAGSGTVGAIKNTIFLNAIGSTALTPGTYTIITAGSALTPANFILGTPRLVIGNNSYAVSLNGTATSESITIGAANPAFAFFTGAADPTTLNATTNGGATTNFSTDITGTTDVGMQPTSLTDVFFTASTVPPPTTIASLGQNYSINSLNFTSGAPAITLNNGGGNTLTLAAGINAVSGTAAHIVNVPLILSGAQTFTNNSLNALTVDGTINTAANTLTIAGSGPITLSNTISGTGVVTVTGSGPLTLSGTSTLRTLNINNVNGVVDIGAGTLTFNNVGGDFIRTSTGATVNGTGGGRIMLGSRNGTSLVDGGDNGALAGTTLTINAIIDGAANIPFEVYGGSATAGTVVLTGANTFLGDVNIDGGILSVATLGNVGVASPLGKGTNIGIAGGGTNALKYTGTGETTNRVINLYGTTVAGAIEQAGTGLLKFTANFATPGAGAKTLTLQGSTAGTGEISGIIGNNSGTFTTGITKAGSGTWTLSGANTYTGPTTILGGTLVAGSATALGGAAGNIVFGNSVTATPTSNTGNLDLTGFSLTQANLTANSNSATANTVSIGAGKTLTLTNGMNIGLDTATAAGATATKLAFSGAGGLSITGGTVNVGVSQTTINAANQSTGTLDLSLLIGSFNASTVTAFNVGFGNTTAGIVTLTNSSNTLTTPLLNVGNSNTNNPAGTSSLILGTGTNVLKADTINVGLSKASGILSFASPLAGAGSVTITNAAGNGAANINIGSRVATGTAAVASGIFDLRGHTATVTAGTVNVGLENGTSTGSYTGSLSFDTGAFTATTLTIASTSNTGSTGGSTGTVNIGGGTFTVGSIGMAAKSGTGTGNAIAAINVSGGTLTVNTAFVLASQTGTASTAGNGTSGTLSITGTGRVDSNVDITKGGGSATGSLVLNGGTLDLHAHNIGSASVPIDNVTLPSGTLMNVAQINNGAAVTKTTGGTLILDGTNTYTGTTTISGGTLQVGAGATTGTLGGGNVIDNALIAFNRSDAITVANAISGSGALNQIGFGTTTLSAVNPYSGATTISSGTLSVSGSINGSSAIAVNDGGTLLLGGTGVDNRLKNDAPVLLGTLSAAGVSNLIIDNAATSGLETPIAFAETLGALTLNSNSIIDVGQGVQGSILNFADSLNKIWASGATLSIFNWTGDVGGNNALDTDQIFFGNSAGTLGSGQLAQISFFSDDGHSLLGGAGLLSNGQLVPVPEPTTWMMGGLMLGLLGYRERRRFARAARVRP